MSDYEKENYEIIRKEIAEQYTGSASLVTLMKLRQFCTHPNLITDEDLPLDKVSNKYIRTLELLTEIFENKEKCLIFTSYTKMADYLKEDICNRFGVYSNVIDGRTEVPDRQKIVDEFSDINSPGVLILNPQAAGTGLNITTANHVIHYNLEWNPALEDQSTARSHRRGQSLPVTVHRLFYANTVEDIINERLSRKRDIAETAIVGTEGKDVDVADIANAISISPV